MRLTILQSHQIQGKSRETGPEVQQERQNWFKVSFLLHNADRMAQTSDLDLIEVLSKSLFVSICLEPQMVTVHHIKTFHIIVQFSSVTENNTNCCDYRLQVKLEVSAIETHISANAIKIEKQNLCLYVDDRERTRH